MNNQIKSWLVILAIIAILLAIIPSIWIKVIILAILSGALIFSIIKYRSSTTIFSVLFYLGCIIGSAILATKMLVNIANEVTAVQIAIAITLGIASLAFLLWLIIALGMLLYRALKKPKQPIN